MLAKKVSSRISQLPFNSPWFTISIFAFLGLIGILNHSMWRDELNPWLIVRDSESFAGLLANIHYEGHPVLWYFSLALLRRIADTPIIMQLFHLGIATGSVAIFWLYSPFNYRQKLLFSFGFFPFSEYLLISRNYAFSMLFIFAFLAVFQTRGKTYLYLAIFLGLLANSNAYGLFVSFALLLTLLVEFWFDIEQRNQYLIKSKKYDSFLSIVIILFSYLLAIYIITPPADSYLHGGLSNGWLLQLDMRHLLKSIGRLFGGYFLIIPTSKRWLDLIICASIALFMVGLTLIKLWKKPFALFFYIIVNSGILAFSYFRFIGSTRHYGHFYLVLLAALWLGSYYQESKILINNKFSLPEKLIKVVNQWHHFTLMIILFIHFCGGIYYFSKDLVVPFSSSRETVDYIQQHKLENEFIVASRDANMAGISGYLNRKLYYPERQGMGSFTLFKKGRQGVEQDEVLRQISLLLKNQADRKRILMILHNQLKLSRKDLKIMPIKNFERGWVDSERFYLYWVMEN
ncbi:hypothetical protein [Cylindrospermum sp. FACHB-282]|uniref:hypothetical protein n=1 Tax=Cylindrospermum sp. FACHB-282 TaxID=2692794 RepID=UPI001686DC7D|nr:hypothetical protein [Cylindrospermum sp. FACHB-282]MBD2385504.1 hypothetical protein [Cylindrospermum sp. FACHB-282]